MKMSSFLLSATRTLALAGMLSTLSFGTQGAALFTLKGEAFDARDPGQSEVRLSVLGWTDADKLDAIEAEYQRYTGTQDHAAFAHFLQLQDSMGYLFTKAATGHSIKYAWQDGQSREKRMLLLVTPALKVRTPYMWSTPNNDPAPFSLVELRFDGDVAIMKTSGETTIESDAEGRLQLKDFDITPDFARLRDATPYYLKN